MWRVWFALLVGQAVALTKKLLKHGTGGLTMNDLISRSALIEKRVPQEKKHRDVCQMIPMQAVLEVPAVDAVEVVRCKDCKWYKESEFLKPIKFCYRLKHPVEDRHIGYNFSDDDYCSYGERKENG